MDQDLLTDHKTIEKNEVVFLYLEVTLKFSKIQSLNLTPKSEGWHKCFKVMVKLSNRSKGA